MRVRLPDRAVRAAASQASTCALLRDGQVWCWGVASSVLFLSPVRIFGGSTHAGGMPRSIVAGSRHFCVVVVRERAICSEADSSVGCMASSNPAAATDSLQSAWGLHSSDTVW